MSSRWQYCYNSTVTRQYNVKELGQYMLCLPSREFLFAFQLCISKCGRACEYKCVSLSPVTSCLHVLPSCRNQSFQAAKRKRKGDQSTVTKSIVSLPDRVYQEEIAVLPHDNEQRPKHPRRAVKSQQAHNNSQQEFIIHARGSRSSTDTDLKRPYSLL